MATIEETIRTAILEKIPDAAVDVAPGSGGHFTLQVVSPVFAGKSMLESQRLVLGAIAHLMKGDGAPVHAIDSLKTKTP
ncbi:MAG: BolA family transcriptional regulator [Labilithrix sp.]|nr:BolA family transcriptional regulator [Labilithrix sp.]